MAKTRKLSPALKAWNVHWKKVRAEMEKKGTFKKGDNLTKVFKEAKKSFKSHKKGGAGEEPVVESDVDPNKKSGDSGPISEDTEDKQSDPASEYLHLADSGPKSDKPSVPEGRGGSRRKTKRRSGRKH